MSWSSAFRLDPVVRAALLAGLSALAVGCPYCPPKDVDEDFEQSTDIYTLQVANLVAEHGGPLETCEDLCATTMSLHNYTEVEDLTITSCSTDVPLPQDGVASETGEPDTGPTSAVLLGAVTCAGHVVGTWHIGCR